MTSDERGEGGTISCLPSHATLSCLRWGVGERDKALERAEASLGEDESLMSLEESPWPRGRGGVIDKA